MPKFELNNKKGNMVGLPNSDEWVEYYRQKPQISKEIK